VRKDERAGVGLVGATVLAAVLIGPTVSVGVEPEGIDPAAARVRAFLSKAADAGFVGVIGVARGDRVLVREGYGPIAPGSERPVRPDAVFTVGSITKQFTAAAVLKLQEAGRLSVQDPITKYLPDVPADKRAITIHQLLTHQAGFPGAIGDDRERIGRDAYVRVALATPLEFAPGTDYRYSNVGYSLAAAIVERVSGRDYEPFLAENLFAPAGMSETGYRLPAWDPSRLAHGTDDDGRDWGTVVERAIGDDGPGWHLLGNGGIHSTVDDMLRWSRALTDDRVLSARSRDALVTPYADEGGGTSYGYGWSIEPSPWGRLAAHNGGNRIFFADYLRYLDADLTVFLATSSRDPRMRDLARGIAEAALGDRVPDLPPPPEARGPVVTAGDGPAAPDGTPAARWNLPGTGRGQLAARFLDAVVSDDAASRRAFVESGFTNRLRDKLGTDALVGVLDQLREEFGERRVLGLRTIGDDRVAVLVETGRHPAPLEAVLVLSAGEPARIDGIEIRVGD